MNWKKLRTNVLRFLHFVKSKIVANEDCGLYNKCIYFIEERNQSAIFQLSINAERGSV